MTDDVLEDEELEEIEELEQGGDTGGDDGDVMADDFSLDPKQVNSDVSINDVELTDAMMRQPGMYAYYATAHQQAVQDMGDAERNRDYVESIIDKEIRDRAAAEGEKVTEKSIEKEIARDKRYIGAVNKYNEAKARENYARNILKAFEHRRDMLIQIASDARKERDGELRVGTDPASHQGLKEAAANSAS